MPPNLNNSHLDTEMQGFEPRPETPLAECITTKPQRLGQSNEEGFPVFVGLICAFPIIRTPFYSHLLGGESARLLATQSLIH